MANPWLKKNPFMSMWLSGANKAVGAARGQIAGSVKREAQKAATRSTAAGASQVLDFWGKAFAATAKPAARKRK